MLDEFSPTNVDTKAPAPASSGPGRPTLPAAEAVSSEGVTDEDFAAQLQAGMADLLGDLGSSVCDYIAAIETHADL
jgi:peroxin-19